MIASGVFQIAVFLGVLGLLAWPLGGYKEFAVVGGDYDVGVGRADVVEFGE